MNTLPSLAAARALLSEGEVGNALRALISGLENEPNFSASLRTLRVLETNWAAARQNEQKGILSFSEAQREYSRIADAALGIVADLEAGRTPAPEVASQGRRRFWLGLGLAFLLAAGGVFFFLSRTPCPKFQADKGLKIMLLEFQNIGSGSARPEISLQNRIRELTTKNMLRADVEINTGYDSETKNPDADDALQLCKTCAADMVVWGAYEKASDSTRLSIQYQVRGWQSANGPALVAVKDITALQRGAMLKDLDDAVFSLCAVIAMQDGNWNLAKKWVEKVKQKDAANTAMLDWLDKNQPKPAN